MKYNLITILGPTAVGKTSLAAKLAHHFNGEIISADSRQVYKGMDIGTGKDFGDYKVDNKIVPFHLIDIVSPKEEFNLFQFRKLFFEKFAEINERKKTPFFAGGTGMYLSSIIQNYSMVEVDFNSERFQNLITFPVETLKNLLIKLNLPIHNTTDLTDKNRIAKAILIAENTNSNPKPDFLQIKSLNIGVKFDREIIKERITKRLKQRLKSGMIEEVQELLKIGITHEKLQFFGLEYKYLSLYLQGNISYNDMFQKLNSAIHQFAKRQMTWFRKMEKEGVEINWVEGADFEAAEKIVSSQPEPAAKVTCPT